MVACNSYKHKPLDLQKSQIRLFRLLSKHNGDLEGEISTHDFEDGPSYRAVSYMWGPPSPTREITIEGCSFTVRENLWQFLCHFLDSEYCSSNSLDSSGNVWLWIDQICIDQSTVEERNHQVGLMSVIYARANRVLVWLGSEADGSGEAIEAITLGCHATRQHAGKVKLLLERPYWSRLWIVQEVLMSRTVTVICGHQSFGLWQLARMYVPDSDDDLSDDPDDYYPVEINDTVDSLIRETSSGVFEKQKLSFILWSFAKLYCEDPRDKVYGLLSLVQDPEVIAVDYSKTSTEVFFDTIQRVVQDETLMAFDSHVDLAKYLRDSMNLGTETSDIESYIKSEVEIVLKSGRMNVQERDDMGSSSLEKAVFWGASDLVRILLDYDLPGGDARNASRSGALSMAAMNGHKEIMQLILSADEADLDARQTSIGTALSNAARCGKEEIVAMLLEDYGADINARSGNDNTPLILAVQDGQEDIVRLLLSKENISINAQNINGLTPLLAAATNGHLWIAKLLLETGKADIEATDSNGRTAIDLARGKGKKRLIELLRMHSGVS